MFIDETGIDTAMHERFGWAPVGETPVIEGPRRGKRTTVVGGIAASGVVACSLFEGSLNGDRFLYWLREDLGPWLPPDAIVVMDQLRVHQIDAVQPVLDEFGATAMYLPAYSPEFNPIELCWAWIKRWLRKPGRRRDCCRSAEASCVT